MRITAWISPAYQDGSTDIPIMLDCPKRPWEFDTPEAALDAAEAQLESLRGKDPEYWGMPDHSVYAIITRS